MTLDTNTPNHDPSLAHLVTMYQAMQAALAYPPSEELKRVVSASLAKATDPLFKSFLNLLVTNDQTHRDLARQIYVQLEVQIAQKRQEQLQLADDHAKALVASSGVVESTVATLPPPTEAPPAASSFEPDFLNLLESAGQENDVPSNVIDLPTRAPTHVPYDSGSATAEHYVMRYSEDPARPTEITREDRYEIITDLTRFEEAPHLFLSGLMGVIVGIRGQTSIEHGFGFVLPLDRTPLQSPDKSLHLPMRLEYPLSMPTYDDHNATNVPGLKEFLALHECMQRGYTVLLDMYVKVNAHPDAGHSLSLTLRQEKLVLRRTVKEDKSGYGPDGAVFSSNDFEDLHLATKRLALVGLLASVQQ